MPYGWHDEKMLIRFVIRNSTIKECEILSKLPERPTFKPGEKKNPAMALIGVIRLFLDVQPVFD